MRSGSLVSFVFLSAAFLAAPALFSSCGSAGSEELRTMKMRGFFLSITADKEIDCGYENADVTLRGDESAGLLDIEIVSSSPTFPGSEFRYEGKKIIRGGKGKEEKIIATTFVIESKDGKRFPGTLYVLSGTDEEIGGGAEIFVGHWAGNAVRPEDNPQVMCPYVLVPRDALSADSCGTDTTRMAAGLRKYFTGDADNPRELGTCYTQFSEEGNFSVEKYR